MHGRRGENEEPHHNPPTTGEQTWEQRFRNLQQELSRVKEVVKGRAPDTMDTLVQQTESPFTPEVLHYPLPAKFRMPQVEAFDGVKDPVDHLNTYKNRMELHGYPDPVRCRAFATSIVNNLEILLRHGFFGNCLEVCRDTQISVATWTAVIYVFLFFLAGNLFFFF